jgi:hypothetical protein
MLMEIKMFVTTQKELREYLKSKTKEEIIDLYIQETFETNLMIEDLQKDIECLTNATNYYYDENNKLKGCVKMSNTKNEILKLKILNALLRRTETVASGSSIYAMVDINDIEYVLNDIFSKEKVDDE